MYNYKFNKKYLHNMRKYKSKFSLIKGTYLQTGDTHNYYVLEKYP